MTRLFKPGFSRSWIPFSDNWDLCLLYGSPEVDLAAFPCLLTSASAKFYYVQKAYGTLLKYFSDAMSLWDAIYWCHVTLGCYFTDAISLWDACE